VLAIVSSNRRPRASTVIARTCWPKSSTIPIRFTFFHRKPADFIAMKSARNLELDRFTSLAHAIEDFQSLPPKL
jgi:hypothetical protein